MVIAKMNSRKEYYREKRRRKRKRWAARLLWASGIAAFLLALVVLWQSLAAVWENAAKIPRGEQTAGGEISAPASPQGKGDGDSAHHDPTGRNQTDNTAEEPAGPAQGGSSEQEQDGSSGRVQLAFVGDVLLGSTVGDVLRDKGYDYPYAHIQPLIEDADIAAANLETPVTERGEPAEKTYVYRSPPEALDSFAAAGFDLVTLANNHILDYGVTGLQDTLHHLDRLGLSRVGAGMDADEAYRPVMVEEKGIKMAFLGFSLVVPEVSWKAGEDHPGVAETYDYRKPVEAIQAAKQQADLVVVFVHWGKEREERPEQRQVEMARRYIDAGADLVIGSHPHVLQSLEQYRGKWIAYSLGNFIFTTNNHPPTWQTVVLQASCAKTGDCSLKLVPVLTKWAQPKPMAADEARELLNRLDQISASVTVRPDGSVE
jgi:poly-gamma-glutamate synthesis protein (capsule biosynthesis protein)